MYKILNEKERVGKANFFRVPVDSSTDQFGDKTIRRQGRTIRWQFYQFGDRWQWSNRV